MYFFTESEKFPSPYGERVKERMKDAEKGFLILTLFPSPYGERVKERVRLRSLTGTGLQRTNRRNPLDRNNFHSDNNFS